MKIDRAHLAPADGRRVRRPDGSVLPGAGELLDLTPYWRRRIADADVVQGAPRSKPRKPA